MTHKNPIAVHGHRGSRGTHPENTIPSFEEAVACGVERIELDIQLTKDDIPVVFHDAAISDRLCLQDGNIPLKHPLPVRSLLFEQLQRFSCGDVFQETFPQQRLISNLRIPTLDQILKWALRHKKKPHLDLEIKIPSRQKVDPALCADKVLEMVDKNDMASRVHILSSNFDVLGHAKKIVSDIPRSYSFRDQKNFPQIMKKKKEEGQIASVKVLLITNQCVEQCHLMHVPVVAWTVNTKKDWASVLEMGVDAMVTDYPRDLIKFCRETGQNLS